MDLNYHHLRIFWAIARTGSLRAAADELHLSQPTLSTQLRGLEETLGHPLFIRAGRRLQLTAEGRLAQGYAEEIFTLGTEMRHALARRDTGRARRLTVGITQSVPKLVARELLRPAFQLGPSIRLICHEGSLEELTERLADFRLDVILADEALSGGRARGMFNHPRGATGVSLAGVAPLAERYRADFPASLDGAPLVLPTDTTPLRRTLDNWFRGHGVRPRVVAEFDDSALMKDFAAEGEALAPIHDAAERQAERLYGLVRAGAIEGVRTEFHAISAERRLRDSGVLAITEQAQRFF
jgi:LysR family transcriptional activator of nhaA